MSELKICHKCNETLVVGENWLECNKKHRNNICQDCERLRNKERWQKANKEELKTKNHEYNEAKMAKYYNGHSCVICGEENPLFLTFHHKKIGDRLFCISNCPSSKLENELKKCVCLCFNHHWSFHRLYTMKKFPNWDDVVEEFKEKLTLTYRATL